MARPAKASARTRAKRLATGLFPHQIDGLAFLLARKRSILADDMGLGKTRQSVIALREARPVGPYLVVCPASVKRNWEREIHLALDGQAGAAPRITVVGGKTASPEPGFDGWVVINYDILKKHAGALSRLDCTGFVFDEAHYLKNYKSLRSRFSKELVEAASDDAVVHCLTGTPMTSRPRDLFPLLQLVGHPLAKSFLSFAKRYCAAHRNQYGWVTDGASHTEELTVQLHGTMLRRRKEDVLDLPEKVRTWIPVDAPASSGHRDARRLLKVLLTKGTEDGGESRFQLLGKLAPARRQLAIAKVKRTTEFIQGIVDQGEKVVVYSCFTLPIDHLAEHFGEAAVVLTGKTPVQKRQAVVDAFQTDDSVRVLAANIIAGGVGINLTAARTVVFNDLDFVPANHWQAEDRAYRIGQTHSVAVYYFTAKGTLDEFVAKVLQTKTQLVSAVVEGQSLAVDGAAAGDVLTELQRLIAEFGSELGPGLAPGPAKEHAADRFLRVATESLTRDVDSAGAAPAGAASSTPDGAVARREAIAALASSFQAPQALRYRTLSFSGEKHYTLEIDASDVTCDCPAFERRGQCKHARALKEATAGGAGIPQEFERFD